MGRTKKRHRAWKQQMRSRARKRRDWGFSWGDISPGRLVAWAQPETPKKFYPTGMERVMDGVGWTALVIAGLLATLVIIMQVGKWFYGW